MGVEEHLSFPTSWTIERDGKGHEMKRIFGVVLAMAAMVAGFRAEGADVASAAAPACQNDKAKSILREAQNRFLAAKTYHIAYRKQAGKMLGGMTVAFDLTLKRHGEEGLSLFQNVMSGPMTITQIADRGRLYFLKPGDGKEAAHLKFADSGMQDVIAQYFTESGTVEMMTESVGEYRIRYRLSDDDKKQIEAILKGTIGTQLPPEVQPEMFEYVFGKSDFQLKEMHILNTSKQLVEKTIIDKLELDAVVDESKFKLPAGCSVKTANTLKELAAIQKAWVAEGSAR